MPENHSGFGRDVRFPQPRSAKRRRVSVTTVALIACTVLLLGVVVWLALPDAHSEESLKQQFQEECYNDLRDKLRDPDSAHFESDSGVIIDSDDGQYTILGDGRARNGFGGMNNFTIACTAYYDDELESFDIDSEIID